MGIVLPDDLMVSVSGFRGVVGSSLTPELLGSLAAAFGAFLGEEGHKLDVGYAALSRRYQEADSSRDDGLRFSWTDRRAWLHVRPSATEPVVRLIAEASDEAQARQIIDESRRMLEGVS